MESFFSLFGPSEGQLKNKKKHKPDTLPDNVKKKADTPKGRRRGRKSNVKNETLPEESSFLCEPDIGSELLVKNGSYFDSYFQVTPSDETKTDAQKPRRRNSGRKSRRRRSKVSPAIELPANAWCDEDAPIEDSKEFLNNRHSFLKPKSFESVGKNVNNLRGEDELYVKKSKRKEDVDEGGSSFEERQVYNVIDSLEKVSLKDDEYTCGDLSPEHLDGSSCSEDEDSCDDSSVEMQVSSSVRLPAEPRFGNVEYKLQLLSVTEHRLQHLVTQLGVLLFRNFLFHDLPRLKWYPPATVCSTKMAKIKQARRQSYIKLSSLKWRLRSGGGNAIYVLGVRDCGALRGLRPRALRGSLRTLRRMATTIGATLTHVTARRVAPHRAVAEVYIRKLAETQQSVELRIAVMGANEAGKSTLIGVLTQGELDNGRGSARLNMFRHVHEVRSGRTSSLSHEILGFDAQGNVVNYGCSELMTAERIGERSAKLVSFLDLAGHSKYQRTTVHGLTGYSPHYCMLVISATAGITQVTEEHLAILSALALPFFIVLTKSELAAPGQRDKVTEYIRDRSGRKTVLITDENVARNCVGPQTLILDSVLRNDNDDQHTLSDVIPLFPVSCVKGSGLNALHAYLLALQPPQREAPAAVTSEQESCEFQIDEIFHVGECSGPVVGGLLASGSMYEGDKLLIGPLDNGEFVEISVKTIYRNRVPCDTVRSGQSASLGLSHYPPNLRQGMVLLSKPEHYKNNNCIRPTFGGCLGKCKSVKNEVSEIITNKQVDKKKNSKAVRRKDKNLLKDLELVENSLKKSSDDMEGNIYKSDDSDAEREKAMDNAECCCTDRVLLEDPSDPRGCLYFQASLLLLRHPTRHISVGFQCTVHIGNVRQTAVIEGIMTSSGSLVTGARASVLFRFVRWAEYVQCGRTVLCRAGPGSRAVGTLTQVFPHRPRALGHDSV